MSATLPPGTMPAAEPGLLTAEEFLRRSPDRLEELARGRIVAMSPPNQKHGRRCLRIAMRLELAAAPTGLGLATTNDSAVIAERGPDTVRGADVSFFLKLSLPGGALPEHGVPEVPPDLIVEVLSPTDRPGEVRRKVNEYLDAGVKLVAVYDPRRLTMTNHRDDRVEVFAPDDDWTIPELLPGFAVKVRELAEE